MPAEVLNAHAKPAAMVPLALLQYAMETRAVGAVPVRGRRGVPYVPARIKAIRVPPVQMITVHQTTITKTVRTELVGLYPLEMAVMSATAITATLAYSAKLKLAVPTVS